MLDKKCDTRPWCHTQEGVNVPSNHVLPKQLNSIPPCSPSLKHRATPAGRSKPCTGHQALHTRRAVSASNGAHVQSKPAEQMDSLSWPGRSHTCAGISKDDVDSEVTICGWVHRNRNMGGLVFSDVRDHTGIFQVLPKLLTEAMRLNFASVFCTMHT